jgi:thiol-disulfide isomerase/thioredoxin
MKRIINNLALFVFLSLIFSSFIGCSNSVNQQSSGNGDVSTANTANSGQSQANAGNNTGSTGASTTKNNDFPAVPATIMQAEIESLNGGNFKLEDRKGKVVLVNLWGIWCAPCIKEMPHLIELQEKYRDKGFEIVGLNVGDEDGAKETAENMKSFSGKMNLNYELAWADDQVYMDLLNVSKFQGVPQSFLIDREGKLHGVFKGAASSELAKMKDNVQRLMETN